MLEATIVRIFISACTLTRHDVKPMFTRDKGDVMHLGPSVTSLLRITLEARVRQIKDPCPNRSQNRNLRPSMPSAHVADTVKSSYQTIMTAFQCTV